VDRNFLFLIFFSSGVGKGKTFDLISKKEPLLRNFKKNTLINSVYLFLTPPESQEQVKKKEFIITSQQLQKWKKKSKRRI
jgi:hypothetical protein